MKGRTYQYAGNQHVVKSFTIEKESEKFVIITDKARVTRKFMHTPDFFGQWFDSKENLAIDKAGAKLKGDEMEITVPAVFGNASGLADELVAILRENIQKVSSNPSYIKQAQVVDKSVGTILNVQKLKLEMYKAAKKNNY